MTRALYSVIIARQSNPIISQFKCLCSESTSVWSMYIIWVRENKGTGVVSSKTKNEGLNIIRMQVTVTFCKLLYYDDRHTVRTLTIHILSMLLWLHGFVGLHLMTYYIVYKYNAARYSLELYIAITRFVCGHWKQLLGIGPSKHLLCVRLCGFKRWREESGRFCK